MATPKIELDRFRTYLEMVRASDGSRLFRHLYAARPRRDLLKDGQLSCAFYVSGILSMHGLIGSMHATVQGTIRDLERHGWVKTSRPKVGCLLVWEEAEQVKGRRHRHIGFYLGKGQAISNSSQRRAPTVHHWTYGQVSGRPKRRVIAKYWHPSFSKR